MVYLTINKEKKIIHLTIHNKKFHELSPKTLKALKVDWSATCSGFLFMYAAIISMVTGKEHGSLRWNVQYRCRNVTDLQ